ncbi:heterokaryon incompatibility protein-domain-containing protein [Lasiosphaeria miniovina]|uniref:Heterokaryon incompatibility protein-domain-containing protein n=1 Tax=Lasiosphaeria miniovina TaxID=1954250 RepID=A0AA40DW88_9PEZI|nr:heterokaryon incompatibility protein-domain-containing protein [Lasiosphaeria miniovina]KAK0717950.1 heterokaryon incompatibility protein-domain-containing protein [Lasiosphaeria miniovina]
MSPLIEYPQFVSDHGAHLYEALSYVWGDSDEPYTVSMNGCDFAVTANLHAALLRLRDAVFERILWVDAICINQTDDKEKESQIGYMAEIYSKASRVIVWLGEAGHDRGDRALDKIRRIAASVADDTPDHEGLPAKRMVALLRRPWFERIWVLQEAAAARDIVIRCGSAEIDGYAFSVALISPSFNYVYKASPDLRSLLGPVTFLIRGAAFRSRGVATPGRPGQVSLGIRPLGELIDMYHSRKATVRHDKVFALLGMSSDHPDLLADILPNYDVAWETLLKRLAGLLLGKQVSVQTWPDTEMAVIRGKGSVLGFVSAVSSHHDMDDRMRTVIDIKRSMTSDQHWGDNRGWTLQPSAKSVQEGDLVCLLRGATKPTIVRLCGDFVSVIIITAPVPLPDEPIVDFERDFLLLWSWDELGDSGDSHGAEKMDKYLKRGVDDHQDGLPDKIYSDKSARLLQAASIYEDVGNYAKAEGILQGVVERSKRNPGADTLTTLNLQRKLAMMYQKTSKFDKSMQLLDQIAQARARLQGSKHPETVRSRADLAPMYRRRRLQPEKLKAVEMILGPEEVGDKVAELAASVDTDAEVMDILLDHRGSEFKITQDVVLAAAANLWLGEPVMEVLLARRGDEIKITRAVVVAAAGNLGEERMIRHVLEHKGCDIEITEDVLVAAAGNDHQGEEVMKYLLEEGDEIKITENVLVAAAGNERDGVMQLLLRWRGNEIEITEGVLKAAARNQHCAERMVKLLESSLPEV